MGKIKTKKAKEPVNDFYENLEPATLYDARWNGFSADKMKELEEANTRKEKKNDAPKTKESEPVK